MSLTSIRSRHVLPGLVLLIAITAMGLHGPISQLANYHHFADQRGWLSIPHAADVLSNIGFALVGLWGLFQLGHARTPGHAGYKLFFASLLLTALGSAWYHLAPDNTRLVWDRLPIALACAGLLSAMWREHLAGGRWVTVALVLLAVASVFWWRFTDPHRAMASWGASIAAADLLAGHGFLRDGQGLRAGRPHHPRQPGCGERTHAQAPAGDRGGRLGLARSVLICTCA